MCTPMVRIKEILHVSLACVLLIVLVSCAMPPPVRKIPSEWVQDVQRKKELRNARWIAQDRMNRSERLLDELGDKINDSDRRQIVEQYIVPLRQAIKGENVDEINDKRGLLDVSAGTLINADQLVQRLTTFFSEFGNKLSPSLRREITKALRSLQKAIRDGDWDEIYKHYGALCEFESYKLNTVKSFQMIPDNIATLGNKLSPSLRNQVIIAIKPFQQAMKGNSWDEITTRYTQLPRFTSYPIEVVDQLKSGQSMLEILGPSEKKKMLDALEELYLAMHGDNWEDVFAKANKFNEIGREFGGYDHWAACVRILSIDGGGVRGIIPAMILAEIEKRTKKHVYELFDLIAGTSTGGILALGLTKPDPKDPRKPAYAAKDLVKLYKEEGEKIFPQKPLMMLRSLWGPKYSPKGIEGVLKNYFGEAYFGDALTNVLIPTYEFEMRRRVYFSTYTDPISPYYMWEVARAASAAPTYFPPFRVPNLYKSIEHTGKDYIALIDGGVFANNPSPYAIAHAREFEYYEPKYPHDIRLEKPYDSKHPLLLLSLGTGRVPSSISFEDTWNWGLLHWSNPLIDIVFSDPGIESETRNLLSFRNYYFRLQPETLSVSTSKLDNASQSNLHELEQIAQKFIDKNDAKINKIVKYLLRDRPTGCTPSVGPKNYSN